jgi:hypothetical protein
MPWTELGIFLDSTRAEWRKRLWLYVYIDCRGQDKLKRQEIQGLHVTETFSNLVSRTS